VGRVGLVGRDSRLGRHEDCTMTNVILILFFLLLLLLFRPHCGSGVDSASNRNEYQEYFLGGNSVGA